MRRIECNRMAARRIGLALAFAAAMPAAAQAPTWQPTGPDGGDILEIVASESYMIASTSGGLYRSVDQAQNWLHVPSTPSFVQSMVISPHDPNFVVAAAGYSLLRSFDGGVTWTSTQPGVMLNALQFNPLLAHEAELLAIASGQPEWWLSPRLMRSVDRGLSWQFLQMSAGYGPLGVTIAPSDGTYYASLQNARIELSANHGEQWTLLVENPWKEYGRYHSQIMVVPGTTALLWSAGAESSSRLIRHDSTGIHLVWTNLGPIHGLFTDPFYNGRMWASIGTRTEGSRQAESLNFGASWRVIPSNRSTRLRSVQANGTMIGSSKAGPMVSTDSGRNWQLRVRGIRLATVDTMAGHPSDGSVIVVTPGGISVSDDRGLTWQETGADIARMGDLHARIDRHPRNPAIGLLSVDRTVYRTTNGGFDWQPPPTNSDLPNARLTSIVYDRSNPDHVSATGSGTQLVWSQDGGLNWLPIQNGVHSLYTAVAGRSGRLYGLRPSGQWYVLLRADRSGDAMTAVDAAPMLTGLAVHPTAAHILLAAGTSYQTTPIHLSTDGGETWQTRSTLPGWQAALLAFDACDSGTVYAILSGIVYRSQDFGRSWTTETPDTLMQGTSSIVTSCVGGLSHVAVSSSNSFGVRVRSPVPIERIATNDFDPL